MMNVVIVGGGAIGKLLGACISKGGNIVTLVEPNAEVAQALNEQGIGLLDFDATSPDAASYSPIRVVTDGSELTNCDLVILAVKSFDTLQAVQQISHLVTDHSPLLSLQTGLGNLELMERVVERRHIIGGFTFMSGTSLGPSIVRNGGGGKTYIGELDGSVSERVNELSTLLNQCSLPCTAVKRVVGRLWCKVIVYSAINTVTSILRVRNGELLEQMESITLLKRLIDEGKSVAQAKAIDLVFPDLYNLLFDTCKKSSGNLSSMFQDILNKKRTEIDAQCGALAAFGEEVGVKTPTQQTMVELIKLIEYHQSKS
ncbi:MAG: 2-dehydropantoate 2-reductase [Proteobacteria bacterium]|nr:2-dehydropantoate 2-reductase [Pseudomonadota bacterium]